MKSKAALQLAKVGRKLSVKSPLIFTGLAISGVIITTYLSFKAAPKAKEIVEDKREDMEMTGPDDKEAQKEVKKELVKELIPVCAPVVISAGSTVAFVVLAHRASNKQLAATVAAYNIYKRAYTEFKDKTKEIVGEKKVSKIHEEIARDRFNAAKEEEIFDTGKGDVRYLDAQTGKKFLCSPEFLDRVENRLNYRLRSEMYVSISEFYSELGVPFGKLYVNNGWNVDDGLIEFEKTAILDDDDRPCVMIDYDVSTRYDYRHLY